MSDSYPQTTEPCPECSSRDVLPIAYGYPGPGMMEDHWEGRVKLGGCCIGPENPQWHCRACGHEWQDPGPGDVPGEEGASGDA